MSLPKIEEDENEMQSPRDDKIKFYQPSQLKKSKSGGILSYSQSFAVGKLVQPARDKEEYLMNRFSSHIEPSSLRIDVKDLIIDEIPEDMELGANNRTEDLKISEFVSQDGIDTPSVKT
jgi:hypothetical protein